MSKFIDRTGESIRANNGMMMTIIKYHNVANIDIQFEDGTVVLHRHYWQFRQGVVKHPDVNTKLNRKRIGETRKANNGLMMTIIGYRSCNDIDIQFEDGIVVKNTFYGSFCNGTIRHPIIRVSPDGRIVNHLGETSISVMTGEKMTIIAYRGVYDIDIQFEDGCIVEHKYYASFKDGNIRHPFPYNFNSIQIENIAYRFISTGNFYCHCTKCGIRDIMTIDEMKSHICSI